MYTNKKSQNREASLGIIASQRIRWGNNRFLNGYDGNKKIKGITNHFVVDQNGFLLAMMVTVANIHDSKAALVLMRVLKSLLCNIKVIIADGEIIEQVKNKFGYIIQVIVRSGKKMQLLNLLIRDGSSKELLLGLIMTEDCVETMSY